MHVMQSVCHKSDNSFWTERSSREQGAYIFGGKNGKGDLVNDLWYIEPLYKHNR